MKHALLAILLIILIPSAAAVECEPFDAFEYSYTNNDETTHRVTFVLLEKSVEEMRVIFEPSTLIVLPDATETFAATARSDEPIEGVQSALFAIRRGTDVVAHATAYFDLTCPEEEPVSDRPIWRDVLFYTAIVLFVVILILVLVLWLLARPGRGTQKTIPESVQREREARAPINVDAMIRAERDRTTTTPWWVWVLALLVVLLIIGVFVYLLVSGMNVEGFGYGAGINTS